MASGGGGVPRTTQVVPGAPVNIVLKADQRTGRQVSGVVRDVLTRGDHHRGIKVRLADGRIGRVQSMAAGGAGGGPAETAAVGEDASRPAASQPPRARGPGRFPHQYEDVRFDGYSEPPQEQADLAAYIVAPKKKAKGRKPAPAVAAAGDGAVEAAPAAAATADPTADVAADVASANATCPVCGAFEGDETAVAHHVATHFE